MSLYVPSKHITDQNIKEVVDELRLLANLANVNLVGNISPCQRFAYAMLHDIVEFNQPYPTPSNDKDQESNDIITDVAMYIDDEIQSLPKPLQ